MKTHQQCPKCKGSDCATVMDNGLIYCHSFCNGIVNKGERMEQQVLDEEFRPYRKVSLDTVKKYEVRTGVTDKGEDKYRVYKYPTGIKYRNLPKSFRTATGFKQTTLFGMDKFNAGTSKHITIVEGEDDALAAYEMLGKKFPVVALPTATFSSDLIDNCYKYLNSFQEIVVCTDSDEVGEKAAQRLAKTFPTKVTRVSMTKRKDPMEFLEHGEDKDFLFAWHNRKKYVPEGITNTPSDFLDILNNGKSWSYLPSPFVGLNESTKGLVKGGITLVLGEEGQGKTEVLRALEYHVVKNNPDVKIAVCHMEESQATNLTTLACYELNKDVRDPDHSVPRSEIEAAVSELTKNKNLYLFTHEEHQEPDEILENIRYLATVCGVEYFFIDPIQQLAYSSEGTDEEKTLTRMSVKLEKMATDLDIGIIMTAHVNDQGQTRSSRMIGKCAAVRIFLKRDHLNDDVDLRNTTHVTITKNRPFSKTGYAGSLKFDPKTFIVSEV